MSKAVEWDEFITPSDFRRMSRDMVIAYKTIDKGRKENLEARILELKSKMNQKVTKNVREFERDYKYTKVPKLKFRKRLGLTMFLFFAFLFGPAFILNPILLDESAKETAAPIICVSAIVLSIVIPMFIFTNKLWNCFR